MDPNESIGDLKPGLRFPEKEHILPVSVEFYSAEPEANSEKINLSKFVHPVKVRDDAGVTIQALSLPNFPSTCAPILLSSPLLQEAIVVKVQIIFHLAFLILQNSCFHLCNFYHSGFCSSSGSYYISLIHSSSRVISN